MIETTILENDRVRLSPLTMDNYANLQLVASEHKLIQYSPSDIESLTALRSYVETALDQQEKNSSLPFIIYDKKVGAFAGCTRYMNIDFTNKVLEIGATWIGKRFQGTGLNSEMKHLLINHAFNKLGFEKITFRIDERNVQSRKAVEKLGAVLEGILRKNVYLLDGYKRNTCAYGIIKNEWDKIDPVSG